MKKLELNIKIEGRVFSYTIRRSKRARRLQLHLDGDGQIEVVLPRGVALREGRRMVEERKEWLLKAMKERKERQREIKKYKFKDGEMFPLLGEERKLVLMIEAGRKRPFFLDGEGFVQIKAGGREQVRDTLVRWYKREARDYFEWKTRMMARTLDKRVDKIVISDAGSQWGSCNKSTGRISLHWRLMLGPRGAADYVIAHEAAHLKESSHSKKFWRVVDELYPGYLEHRKWLQRYGHTLVL